MEKKGLIDLINEILVPLNFKRKGNYWINKGIEITKSLDLQKSRFSNSYYINWGYIINSLPLDGLKTHTFERLASTDFTENIEINNLLNLENGISDEVRFIGLKRYVAVKIIPELNEVDTENDLLTVLKRRPNLYAIPGIVMRHYNLS